MEEISMRTVDVTCDKCGSVVRVTSGQTVHCSCGQPLTATEHRDPAAAPAPARENDLAAAEQLHRAFQTIRSELKKVIVGQEKVLEELLVAIFARGHCLLVGVPGLAKTLMIHTLADSL